LEGTASNNTKASELFNFVRSLNAKEANHGLVTSCTPHYKIEVNMKKSSTEILRYIN